MHLKGRICSHTSSIISAAPLDNMQFMCNMKKCSEVSKLIKQKNYRYNQLFIKNWIKRPYKINQRIRWKIYRAPINKAELRKWSLAKVVRDDNISHMDMHGLHQSCRLRNAVSQRSLPYYTNLEEKHYKAR